MDTTILLVAFVFLGLVGVIVYLIRDEIPKKTPKTNRKSDVDDKKTEVDPVKYLQKKMAQGEEKLKSLELSFETMQFELTQTKDREKNLLKQKSEDTFDREQYEKSKKEHQTLKNEVAQKEDALEKEIALRRQQSSELLTVKQDRDELKKRLIGEEDAHRKAQTTVELLTKELNDLKRKIMEQSRIVQEHATSKIEGEWISRAEFDKVEKELQEKETLIKKMLSINKEAQR